MEALLQEWPHPIEQLTIMGHSMGGLVARSACHHALLVGHAWAKRLDPPVALGRNRDGYPTSGVREHHQWVGFGMGHSISSAMSMSTRRSDHGLPTSGSPPSGRASSSEGCATRNRSRAKRGRDERWSATTEPPTLLQTGCIRCKQPLALPNLQRYALTRIASLRPTCDEGGNAACAAFVSDSRFNMSGGNGSLRLVPMLT